MTAQISAYGRLVADPQTRTTTSGTRMTMARLAVSLPCNATDEGQATFWLGVVAFGKQAEVLARHQKGDLVSVAGNMQLNQWSGQDGIQKEQPQVIADSVISARTSRPNTAARPPATGHAQSKPTAPGRDVYNTPPYDDQ